MDPNTREWLGLTPADLVLYAAYALLGLALWARHPLLFGPLLGAALAVAILAARAGVRARPGLTARVLLVKRTTYPLAVVLLLVVAAGKVYYHLRAGGR